MEFYIDGQWPQYKFCPIFLGWLFTAAKLARGDLDHILLYVFLVLNTEAINKRQRNGKPYFGH